MGVIPPSTKQDVRHLNETLRLCIPSYVTTFTGTVVQKVQKVSLFYIKYLRGYFLFCMLLCTVHI